MFSLCGENAPRIPARSSRPSSSQWWEKVQTQSLSPFLEDSVWCGVVVRWGVPEKKIWPFLKYYHNYVPEIRLVSLDKRISNLVNKVKFLLHQVPHRGSSVWPAQIFHSCCTGIAPLNIFMHVKSANIHAEHLMCAKTYPVQYCQGYPHYECRGWEMYTFWDIR